METFLDSASAAVLPAQPQMVLREQGRPVRGSPLSCFSSQSLAGGERKDLRPDPATLWLPFGEGRYLV